MREAALDLVRGVTVHGALPVDRTCAGAARSMVGDLLGALHLPLDAIRDAQTMVSEAATNALDHAGIPLGEARGPYELWAYRSGRRVVCGVFDPVPERGLPARAGTPRTGLLDEHGRGLTILNACSDGRWGVHLSRAQLGAHLPGKVVWFACPAEVAFPGLRFEGAADMARTVGTRLGGRGVGGTILSACPRLALLSVCRGLDVWCRAGRFYLREESRGPLVRPAGEVAGVVEHLYAGTRSGGGDQQVVGAGLSAKRSRR